MRRREIDLEFRAGRNFAGIAQPPENGIGLQREIAIGQVIETDIVDSAPGFKLEASMPARRFMHAPGFAGELQLCTVAKTRPSQPTQLSRSPVSPSGMCA